MKICYVHGAGASERSFVWLQKQLPSHAPYYFTHSVKDQLSASIMGLSSFVIENDITMIIGHSIGGVMAAACVDCPSIEKIVSLCSPFGGMRYAEYMYMYSREQLFYDMRQYGPILSAIRAKSITKPHLAIIGTKSLPFTSEPNDGVVTVVSQTALYGPHYEITALNHFEVLLSKEVAGLISSFMEE